jgi:CBS domain-containing protein
MLTVRHLLEKKARTLRAIRPEAPVLDAIRSMAEHHVGALVVMQGDELLGIVSERDYARKVILLGRSSAHTAVREIMTSPVITVSPLSTLDECMREVTEHRVRYLPVMENGRVTGVVSIGDLIKAVIEEQQHTIEQLESYIHS